MKKLLSYFFPIRLKNYTSKISGALEVNLINGKKVLDTVNSNYSYGSLQKILHRGLVETAFPDNVASVLVLGLGGGSIVHTIRTHFKSDVFITLVDIDSEIISIAKNEFGLAEFEGISIIHEDAIAYLNQISGSFDLIIVDVFIVDTIPKAFTELGFMKQLKSHLNEKGKIIFNTLRETMQRELFDEIKKHFIDEEFRVKVLHKVERCNDLIIAERD